MTILSKLRSKWYVIALTCLFAILLAHSLHVSYKYNQISGQIKQIRLEVEQGKASLKSELDDSIVLWAGTMSVDNNGQMKRLGQKLDTIILAINNKE